MTTLKTLKELNILADSPDYEGLVNEADFPKECAFGADWNKRKDWSYDAPTEFVEREKFIEVKDLKQEAIKWVKDGLQKKQLGYLFANNILMQFFNLTEDDLQ